jgi:hypothetical protein
MGTSALQIEFLIFSESGGCLTGKEGLYVNTLFRFLLVKITVPESQKGHLQQPPKPGLHSRERRFAQGGLMTQECLLEMCLLVKSNRIATKCCSCLPPESSVSQHSVVSDGEGALCIGQVGFWALGAYSRKHRDNLLSWSGLLGWRERQ